MPAKVKGKKTKRKRGSQATMAASARKKTRPPDGRAREHTHPSQMPDPDAVRRSPGFVIRAKRDVIDAINILAKERGVSRNTLVVELLTRAISKDNNHGT